VGALDRGRLMQAATTAVVGVGGVLESVSCQSPVTVRQVRAEHPGTCALCVVGSAAGPLTGDHLSLDLTLRPGARATLAATGASLAQGDNGGSGRLETRVQLGAAAVLHARPAAVIVAAGGSVDVRLDIELADDANIEWRELLVLGRSGETPGKATLHWNVTRSGRPVLRQTVDLTDPTLTAWPGMLAGGRVIASAFLSGPDVVAQTRIASETAVAARLDANTCLVTVLGTDVSEVSAHLDALCMDLTLSGGRLVGATCHTTVQTTAS